VSQQGGGRYQRSVGGMVGAMVFLVALVVVWVGIRALTSQDPPSPVQTVDYTAEASAAGKAADFPLLSPTTLPPHWRATTVRFTPPPETHWHLGVLTGQDRYVGLEQADVRVSSMVSQYVDQAARRGHGVVVRGAPWQTWSDAQGDVALVRRSGRATTLVVGHDVTRAALTAYVASLR
jgi:hypothetical protein